MDYSRLPRLNKQQPNNNNSQIQTVPNTPNYIDFESFQGN